MLISKIRNRRKQGNILIKNVIILFIILFSFTLTFRQQNNMLKMNVNILEYEKFINALNIIKSELYYNNLISKIKSVNYVGRDELIGNKNLNIISDFSENVLNISEDNYFEIYKKGYRNVEISYFNKNEVLYREDIKFW